MRKNTTTAKLTEFEKDCNKKISKLRYIVEQYFGISHLHDRGQRARFSSIAKNNIDIWIRQAAFNIRKGIKIVQKMKFRNQISSDKVYFSSGFDEDWSNSKFLGILLILV